MISTFFVLVILTLVESLNGDHFDSLSIRRLDTSTNFDIVRLPNYHDYVSLFLQQLRRQVVQDEEGDKVKIQVYYECLCPDCRQFDATQLKDAVRMLGPYLDVHTYPYGNAQTYIHDGKYEFSCQHGPDECYGNKLHACAIDLLKNATLSVFYNSCLMDSTQAGRGSDDRAVDVCSQSMGLIEPNEIKQCARGDRGTLLLEKYGDESKKAAFNAVPYILINGLENDGNNFIHDVCKTFENPPAECKDVLQ